MQSSSVSVYYCSLVLFLCKYLKTKSGNKKKIKRARWVMEGTEGERSSWINKDKTQATGFPWLMIWYNIECQVSEYSYRLVLVKRIFFFITRVLISGLTHRKKEEVVFPIIYAGKRSLKH